MTEGGCMRAARRAVPIAALALSFASLGQQDAAVDRESFLTSVTLEAEAAVCAERAPALAEEIRTALDAWKLDNAESIERGAALVRADEHGGVSFEDYLAHLRSLAARFYEVASAEEAARMCEERFFPAGH